MAEGAAQNYRFPANILALADVAHPEGRDALQPFKADTILAGAQFASREPLIKANDETRARKRLKIWKPDQVSQAEILDAGVREYNILRIISAAEGNGEAVDPPWAELTREIQEMRTELKELKELSSQAFAISSNARLRHLNSQRIVAVRSLFPLAKELPGAGDGLLRTVLPQQWRVPEHQIPPPLPVAPAVGSFPNLIGNQQRGCFPDNLAFLNDEMTDVDILRLIQHYNDDFGILPPDSLETRKSKVKNFICFEF